METVEAAAKKPEGRLTPQARDELLWELRAVTRRCGIHWVLALFVPVLILAVIAAVILGLMAVLSGPLSQLRLAFAIMVGSTSLVLLYGRRVWLGLLRARKPREAPEAAVELSRHDAPGLFKLADGVARSLGARKPKRMELTMGCNASTQPTSGKGRAAEYMIRFGLDLFVALSEDEIRGVVAHEIGHVLNWPPDWRSAVESAARADSLEGLRQLEEKAERADKRSVTFSWVLGSFARDLKELQGLLAALSRDDELVAEAAAVRVSGADSASTFRLKVSFLSCFADTITWAERNAMAETGKYGEKLLARMWPEGVDTAKLLEEIVRDDSAAPTDTHPVPSAYLGLTRTDARDKVVRASSLHLIGDFDGLARRVLANAASVRRERERTGAEGIDTWLRAADIRELRPFYKARLGIIAAFIGFTFAAAGIVGLRSPVDQTAACLTVIVLGLAAALGGAWLMLSERVKDTPPLPIPEFEAWEESIEHRTETKWDPRAVTPNRCLSLAYAALERCDYVAAYNIADEFVDMMPRLWHLRLVRGIAHAAKGRRKEAGRDIDTLALYKGSTFSVNWALAWGLCLTGRWESATMYLRDSLKARPDHPTLLAALGMAYRYIWLLHDSETLLRKALAARPGSDRMRRELARTLGAMGRMTGAMTVLKPALRGGHPSLATAVGAIEVLLAQDRDEDAFKMADQVLQENRDKPTLAELAATFIEMNVFSQGATLLEESQTMGRSTDTQITLARLYIGLGDVERAEERLHDALDLRYGIGATGEDCWQTVLPDAIEVRASLAEPREDAPLWKATLIVLDQPAGPPAEVDLIVAAPDFSAAQECVRELHELLHSAGPAFPEALKSLATWESVEPPPDDLTLGVVSAQVRVG